MICEKSMNLGDQIQCIAAARLLPHVDQGYVAREDLAGVTDETVVVMNAWFGPSTMTWPPSEVVRPVYFGFHVTDRHGSVERLLGDQGVAHLREHAPIGCRDPRTRDLLSERGIDASVTWCSTLTLPRRESKPRNGKVFLVNADYVPVPRALRRGAIKVNHNLQVKYRPETQLAMAKDLLAMYRDEAKLVITTKIHCAMPCAAMGIPTVFIGDADHNTRLAPIRQILPVNQYRHHAQRLRRRVERSPVNQRFLRSVDWDPAPVDYEKEKEEAVAQFQVQLQSALR